MHLQFVESESTFAYFHATWAYLEAWGKPVAFYSDKHGGFGVSIGTSLTTGLRPRAMMISSPASARAISRDKWVLAAWIEIGSSIARS
jgi:hypothetical protein